MLNYSQLCNEVCLLATEAGKFIAQQCGHLKQTDIHTKGLHDFVTEVDKAAELKIVTRLQELLPEAGFIAEENTVTFQSEEYNWIVDPLDGTTNFIHGVPIFAVSIALAYKKEIVLGVVYEVGKSECFYAWKDSPAYLNGKEIHVSNEPSLEKSLLATGFPFINFNRIEPYMQMLVYTMQHTRGLRRLGSAAADLAYVACGRFDGFYEYGLKPWDVAAGAFIVQQAGGCNADFLGGENFVFGQEIVSANKFIFKELLLVCGKFFLKP